MQTCALDPTHQLIPIAVEQPDGLLDELSLLRQRIALLEQALEDACQYARYDHATGISNSRLLEERFEHAKARSGRRIRSLGVLFRDIDGLMHVNDAHGHVVGDDLLRRVATRLVGRVRISDSVCRFGLPIRSADTVAKNS